MFIVFEKDSKKVVKLLDKEPVSVSNTLEVARVENIPVYDETYGDYLTVINLEEKTEKYAVMEWIEEERTVGDETYLESVEKEVEKERSYFICDLVVNESPNKAELIEKQTEKQYENRVTELIRKKYSVSAELAILRQRDTKPEEFTEYNTYAEECKLIAKQELGI